MKAIIIEDSEIELENLKILLLEFQDVELIGTADTMKNGIELANCECPDLIFLDIQLECENSLQHIHQLKISPIIICTTLYDDHALEAFEVGVSDYLTKPITHDKLNRALQRLPERMHPSVPRAAQILSLKRGNTIHRIPLSQILHITSARDYTLVRDENNTEFISSRRIREWSGLLPSDTFLALDRSTLINQTKVESFSTTPSGERNIQFKNGSSLPVGATAMVRLKKELGASL